MQSHSEQLSADSLHDVAILELDSEPLDYLQIPNLQSSWKRLIGAWSAFGFPSTNPSGWPASGSLLDVDSAQFGLMHSDAAQMGMKIQGGFSGSAVWSDNANAIVGMVVDGWLEQANSRFIPYWLIFEAACSAQVDEKYFVRNQHKVGSQEFKAPAPEVELQERLPGREQESAAGNASTHTSKRMPTGKDVTPRSEVDTEDVLQPPFYLGLLKALLAATVILMVLGSVGAFVAPEPFVPMMMCYAVALLFALLSGMVVLRLNGAIPRIRSIYRG